MLDFWENFIIHAALGVITMVVKNPAKKAAMQHTLVTLADGIYTSYDYTLPTHP